MRYMIIIKTDPQSEQGMPPPAGFEAMTNYSKSLLDAGVLRAVEGLTSSGDGKRITVANGRRVVRDGPFAEAKELIGGFWIIEVTSEAEAADWAQRVPSGEGTNIELRRIAEIDDFKAVMSPRTIALSEAIREALGKHRS